MFELHEFKSPNSYQDHPLERSFERTADRTTNRTTNRTIERRLDCSLAQRQAAALEAQTDDALLSTGETLLLLAALGSVLASLWVTANALI